MISVIVPVYNVEKYLNKCVESIVNQTYKDLEIILVDDGSPDNCNIICDQWVQKDSRIKVIHKKNGGVSNARNVGLENATGNYIAFVDSDDYVDPKMFEELLNSIICNKSEIAVCKAFTISLDGKISETTTEITNDFTLDRDEAALFLFNAMNNALWNKLFKKALIDDIRFEAGKTFGEDPYFLVQALSKCSKVSFVSKPLYYYRKNRGSITSTRFSERKFDQVYFKDKMYEFMKENFEELVPLSNKWRFTSRLNICRMLYLSKKHRNYKNIINEYQQFMKSEYCVLNTLLSKNEKIEYNILRLGSIIYTVFVKLVFAR